MKNVTKSQGWRMEDGGWGMKEEGLEQRKTSTSEGARASTVDGCSSMSEIMKVNILEDTILNGIPFCVKKKSKKKKKPTYKYST